MPRPTLATQASDWGSTGSAETLRRHGLSAGKSGQSPIVATPVGARLLRAGVGVGAVFVGAGLVGALVGGAGCEDACETTVGDWRRRGGVRRCRRFGDRGRATPVGERAAWRVPPLLQEGANMQRAARPATTRLAGIAFILAALAHGERPVAPRRRCPRHHQATAWVGWSYPRAATAPASASSSGQLLRKCLLGCSIWS